MKKEGFTLIELLAVILILGIITLIAMPIVNTVIDKAKQSAYKQSAIGLVESADVYYTKSLRENFDNTVKFIFTNGEQTSEEKLEYSGKISGTGEINLYNDGKVSMCIDNGKYYATKSVDSDEVKSGKGTCGDYNEVDGTYAVIDLVSKEEVDKLISEINSLRVQIRDAENTYTNTNIISELPTNSELVNGINDLTDIPENTYYYDKTTGIKDITTLKRYVKTNSKYYECDEYGNIISEEVAVVEDNLIMYTEANAERISVGSACYASKKFVLGSGGDVVSCKNASGFTSVSLGNFTPGYWGSGDGVYTRTYDIKTLLPDRYNDLTTNNFFINMISAQVGSGGSGGATIWVNRSYDSATGILSVNMSIGGDKAGYCSTEIFLIY